MQPPGSLLTGRLELRFEPKTMNSEGRCANEDYICSQLAPRNFKIRS